MGLSGSSCAHTGFLSSPPHDPLPPLRLKPSSCSCLHAPNPRSSTVSHSLPAVTEDLRSGPSSPSQPWALLKA